MFHSNQQLINFAWAPGDWQILHGKLNIHDIEKQI